MQKFEGRSNELHWVFASAYELVFKVFGTLWVVVGGMMIYPPSYSHSLMYTFTVASTEKHGIIL